MNKDRFALGHAADEDWAASVESCLRCLGDGPFGDGPGFVYATDRMADHLADIVQGLRDGTGVEHWVGCLGMGISAGGEEYFDRPALAAMVGMTAMATAQTGCSPAWRIWTVRAPVW